MYLCCKGGKCCHIAQNNLKNLHFDFFVVSSPDSTADEDNIELQDYAAEILEDILINAEANGSLIKSESKND